MMSGPKFSASILLAAFLSFAPSALGQSPVDARVGGTSFLTQTPATVLVLTFGPNGDYGKRGCGDKDRRRAGNCTQVPEGGTTFMYLTLAGLCCLATGIFTIRRRNRSLGTN